MADREYNYFVDRPKHLVEAEMQGEVSRLKRHAAAIHVKDEGALLDFELPEDKRSGAFQPRADRIVALKRRIDGLKAAIANGPKKSVPLEPIVPPQDAAEPEAAKTPEPPPAAPEAPKPPQAKQGTARERHPASGSREARRGARRPGR